MISVSHKASLSDHCGIMVRMKVRIEKTALQTFQRRTYWKLNAAILEYLKKNKAHTLILDFKINMQMILLWNTDFMF